MYISLTQKTLKVFPEIKALKALYQKYGGQIEFVSIYLESKPKNDDFKKRVLQYLDWPVFELPYYHPIWKKIECRHIPLLYFN